ncbi:tellurite resistance protein TehB [Thalassovita gelatinovora]|uniref:Tellurite resistance protein TehB n=1 Tax=Thalassovita gelatinovora TaxID=53501 RepID=A0A0P1FFC2_THAGE|nr:class I SAM-dependent methyltransferase [Thalassovita gelatinovora]QIZ79730.1 class I SAM-dependent methyltransferase [Thalassovita gelatinovora]CUH66724.1 tellurite resistance protein TehB [Thalassovita gelatinovora]SEQ41681.1 Methyltransferase domain-containing protein [Thalassovita gelatinovora]
MWEKRFAATDDYVFGTEPAQFLTEHTDYLVADATALSVADGEGRNSVWMAQQGLRVTALEFAPSAIAKAQNLAEARNVSVDFRRTDVLRYDWPQTYDLVFGIFIQFVGPDERHKLFEGIKQAVKPGGLVLLHGYTPKQLEHGTGGPPFAENMYTDAILRAAFAGWGILECRAYEREVQEGRGHSGQSALIDFVARKPE